MHIKINSIVKLKSGGPRMIVQQVESSIIHCTWFDEVQWKKRNFSPHELKVVKEGE